jgi:hypothetical protein
VLPLRLGRVREAAEGGNATTAGDEATARVTMIAGMATEVVGAGCKTLIATFQAETPRTITGIRIGIEIEGIGSVTVIVIETETETPAVVVTGGTGTAVDNEAVVAGGVAVAAVAVRSGVE